MQQKWSFKLRALVASAFQQLHLLHIYKLIYSMTTVQTFFLIAQISSNNLFFILQFTWIIPIKAALCTIQFFYILLLSFLRIIDKKREINQILYFYYEFLYDGLFPIKSYIIIFTWHFIYRAVSITYSFCINWMNKLIPLFIFIKWDQNRFYESCFPFHSFHYIPVVSMVYG